MTLIKMIGRLALVVGMFALYSLAEGISVAPTMIGGSAVNPWVVAGIFIASFGGLIYLLASVYRRWLRADQPQAFGSRRLDRRTLRFMLAMGVALTGIQLLSTVAVSLHWVAEAENQDALMQLMQQAPLAMVLVVTVGAAPVEELIFRGLLIHSFPHLDQRGWLGVASAVSAIVFGLLHAGPSEPFSMVIYIAMGAVFTATYVYTKDIRYSIALHFLNNFVALFI